MLFLWPSFPQTHIKNDRVINCCVFKLHRCSVKENHFMHFLSESSALKFLHHGVDGTIKVLL